MNLCTPRRGAAIFVWLLVAAVPVFSSDPVDQLIDADHWKKAHALSEQRLKMNPDDARAAYGLSKVEENFGHLDVALPLAEKAVGLDKASADFHAQLAEVYAKMADESNMMRGLIYVRRMRRELDAALAIDPHNLDALLVDMMFSWKAPSLAGGDKRKAVEIAERLKSFNPAWGNLAEARLFQDQDSGRSQRALERAGEVRPALYRAKVLLAEFYVTKLNRLEDAERIAKEAEQMAPDRAGAYTVLARVYAMRRHFHELAETLAEAEKRDPEDLSPYYFAAKTLAMHGSDPVLIEQFARKYLSQPTEARAPELEAARTLLASVPKLQATREPNKPGVQPKQTSIQ